MDDIALFDSPLGADGGIAGQAAIDSLGSATALDFLNPIGAPIASALNATGQAEMTGVTTAADTVSNIIPSKTTIFSAGILVAVILLFVFLILGKVQTL